MDPFHSRPNPLSLLPGTLGALEDLVLEDRGSEKKVVARLLVEYRPVHLEHPSSSQRFAVDDKNSGNELVAALRTTGSPAPLFPLKILLATGGKIVVLIRVEKKYGEVDGGGRRERFEKLFARCIVEMNEGYIISRDKKKNN